MTILFLLMICPGLENILWTWTRKHRVAISILLRCLQNYI